MGEPVVSCRGFSHIIRDLLSMDMGDKAGGDLMKLYLGQTLIGSFRDDALGDGMVGVVLTGEGHAVFSDFIVEGSTLSPAAHKPTVH